MSTPSQTTAPLDDPPTGADEAGSPAGDDVAGPGPAPTAAAVSDVDPAHGAGGRARTSGGTGDGEAGELLVREGDAAADYLEQLLDIVDYDGDIDLDVENDRAVVAIVGSDLSALVGPDGSTLDALQELTRLAVQQATGVRSRLMLDISGHRQNRRKQLAVLAERAAQTVVDTREAVRLAPMNPFERKVVHDSISGFDGVRSESEGDEPNRRVVVHPGN